MYTDEDLDSAVAAGALTAGAAAALRAHVATLRSTTAVDEENFRLIAGFNDIFVVIACTLLLLSLGWLVGIAAPWLGALAIAAAAWGLGEFFIRKRRMALPAILLLLAVVGGVVGACLLAWGPDAKAFIAGGIAGAAVAGLHWMRFRVPITVAAGVAAVVGCVIAFIVSTGPGAMQPIDTALFASGVVVFALALWWDASDPSRQTRRSDVAFWLHLLAAPLIVRPVFHWVETTLAASTAAQAGTVVGLYVLIALVSLCIDRRALMVSALTYVLYVVGALLGQYGFMGIGLALSALVVGSALLLLSAFWHASRVQVMQWVPVTLQRHLPPLR